MGRRIHRYALLTSILIGGCASPQAAEVSAMDDAQAQASAPEARIRPVREVDPAEAYARGLAFLIEHQNADGSFGSFESARPSEIYRGTVASFRAFRDATSALAVMALIEPSRDNREAWAAIEKGVAHLLTCEPVGRATPNTFYDTWSLTYVLRAAARLHMDARFAPQREELGAIITATIEALGRRQGADGGWGYYDFGYGHERPTGLMSNSFNTASVLLAFDEAQRAGFEVDSRIIRDALRAVERLRLPNGAYVYGTGHRHMPAAMFNRVKGSLARSQPCNLALWVYERDITPDDVRASLDDMREHHHFLEIALGRPRPHEAWYQNSGYYFYYGHFYAADAARLLGDDGRDFLDWQRAMVANLQRSDGSWYDFPMYGYHRAYGTAYALLILERR